MRLVVEYLPKVLDRLDDIETRGTLSWIAFLTCSQFLDLGGGVGVTPAHTLEHGLSAYFDIAHGDGLAAILPGWMRYVFPAKQGRLHSLGKNVFGQADGVEATERWLEKIGMKFRLRDLGIDLESFESMAGNAVRTSLAASPQPGVTADYAWYKNHPDYLDTTAAVQIYKAAY
jgi:alcohol dehydrogenase YqhD (iron-dependent ADH family)